MYAYYIEDGREWERIQEISVNGSPAVRVEHKENGRYTLRNIMWGVTMLQAIAQFRENGCNGEWLIK